MHYALQQGNSNRKNHISSLAILLHTECENSYCTWSKAFLLRTLWLDNLPTGLKLRIYISSSSLSVETKPEHTNAE